MTIKPLRKCFVVVMDNGHTCMWSIAWRKKDCIAAYASGIGESDTIRAWESAKKRGHVFPGLFKGERSPRNSDYKNAYDLIRAAKAGNVSEARARALLEKHGGEMYRVTVRFEVAQ